jgi:hypothetical protein
MAATAIARATIRAARLFLIDIPPALDVASIVVDEMDRQFGQVFIARSFEMLLVVSPFNLRAITACSRKPMLACREGHEFLNGQR